MADEPEPMDTDAVLEQLNRGLELQLRSLLQFTQASGSMFGIEVQGVTGKLWDFAQHELEDTRLLVEKITALGGDPTTEVGELEWDPDPGTALDHLIDTEDEVTETLHAVIPHSGQEAASEALEHLMEHVIMRKQNQIDWLRRARSRRPGIPRSSARATGAPRARSCAARRATSSRSWRQHPRARCQPHPRSRGGALVQRTRGGQAVPMVTTALPRPAALLAGAVAPGGCPHRRQRDLVRASLIARP